MLGFHPPANGPPLRALFKSDVVFDHTQWELAVDDHRIPLTPQEWAFMRLLHDHFGEVVHREIIEGALYDALDEPPLYSSVTHIVKRLRPKLAKQGLRIRTRFGFGYALESGL